MQGERAQLCFLHAWGLSTPLLSQSKGLEVVWEITKSQNAQGSLWNSININKFSLLWWTQEKQGNDSALLGHFYN